METTTYQEIQGLARMTVGELREKYLDVFGEETRSYHKEFLRKRIAWRIQVLADDADLRIRTPRDPVKSGSAEVRTRTSISHLPPSRDPRLPLPGTLLARDFKGRDIVVKVLDNGFEFEGRRYKSLSAIAKEVTGSKWNGFLFFGLADGGTAQSGNRNTKRRNE